MTTHNHPIAAEELMAYLDGELPSGQATATARHLEDCMECQQLTADLRGLSQTVKTWEVSAHEDSPMPPAVAAALDARAAAPGRLPLRSMSWSARLRYFLKDRSLLMPAFGAVAVLIVGSVLFIGHSNNVVFSEVALSRDDLNLSEQTRAARTRAKSELQARQRGGILGGQPGVDKNGPQSEGTGDFQQWLAQRGPGGSMRSSSTSPAAVANPNAATGLDAPNPQKAQQQEIVNAANGTPMVIRTAGLALITKDFDKARTQVEEILRRHHGYVGSLTVTGATGSGRTLAAALRIPSPQLDASIVDFKSLGRLDSESQNGEDVTSQYVDLNARLENSRHTEQRLTDLLQNRTGKLSDVLSVENELARVRGEIEGMEAERKTMANQVDFATLNLTITEDYRAQLQVVPPSTSTRLSNAAVAGYRNLTDGLMSVALFFLESGPTLLLWAAILFFPARFAWKKLHNSFAH